MGSRKNTFYFSHDGNARNDEKILSIRMKYGAEGYGIYFMILERLLESSEYMSVKVYNEIAFDLRVDAGKVKSIIEDFGLFSFTDDGKCFYSESFINRMKPLDNMKKQRQEAGRKSAEKRAERVREGIHSLQKNATTVERPLPKNPTKENRIKESIVNNYIPPNPPRGSGLDFPNPEFEKIWNEWIDYRREIKKTFKSPKTEQVAINRWVELSNNDLETAKNIITQSIGNGWVGLFELDKKSKKAKSGFEFKPKQIDVDKIDFSKINL